MPATATPAGIVPQPLMTDRADEILARIEEFGDGLVDEGRDKSWMTSATGGLSSFVRADRCDQNPPAVAPTRREPFRFRAPAAERTSLPFSNPLQQQPQPREQAHRYSAPQSQPFAFNLPSPLPSARSEEQSVSSPSPQVFFEGEYPEQLLSPAFSSQQIRPSAIAGPSRLQPLPARGSRETQAPQQARKDTTMVVPVSRLPDQHRSLFRFPTFNRVQSACFDAAYRSDENLCISAPTGAGKTVIFELAVLRMLSEKGSDAKAVYIAPTKALCTERSEDWAKRFRPLGVTVAMLTGDSSYSGVEVAKKANIIVTTPEKWDSVTRRWSDNAKVLGHLALILVDEVHLLRERGRGPRLEVVIARMKSCTSGLRFLALSATVPNLDDIAQWIGSQRNSTRPDMQDRPAHTFSFGEEYRPCPLKKYVYGYTASKDHFAFVNSLNGKIMGLIEQHAERKQSLIFVATRKGTSQVAERLATQYEELAKQRKPLPWNKPKGVLPRFKEAKLQEVAALGIAFHHAGLAIEDRRSVESAFLSGQLQVLCSTTTLAVGVNLPAYCVIIRGTKTFSNGAWAELSDLDFLQMTGRAGRPEFDSSGCCIVMCEANVKQRYTDLAKGQTVIESMLHKDLKEHLTAEITQASATMSVQSVMNWLRGTFMFVRMRKNPYFYRLDGAPVDATLTAAQLLENLCENALACLDENDLVSRSGNEIRPTELGDILTSCNLRYETMGVISQLKENSSIRDILELICSAVELSDIRFRQGEKAIYQKLRSHPEVRFPPAKVEGSKDKVNFIVQAVLAGLPLQEVLSSSNVPSNPVNDAVAVFRPLGRICRGVGDLAIMRGDAGSTKSALELMRSINGKAWDGSPVTLRQIEGIGEKSFKVLASAGITSIADLTMADPRRIELLLSRNPPFGNKIISAARAVPALSLVVSPGPVTRGANGTVKAKFVVEVDLLARKGILTSNREGLPLYVTLLCMTTGSNNIVFFAQTRIKKLFQGVSKFDMAASLTRSSEKIVVIAALSDFAGSAVRADYRPDANATWFALPDFRKHDDARQDELSDEFEQDFNDDDLFEVDEQSGKKLRQSTSSTTALRTISELPPAHTATAQPTTKLPNGNWKCNHTCKGPCRHLCCREGMHHPPKPKAGITATAANKALTKASADAKAASAAIHPPRARIVDEGSDPGQALLARLARITGSGSAVSARALQTDSSDDDVFSESDDSLELSPQTSATIKRKRSASVQNSSAAARPQQKKQKPAPQLYLPPRTSIADLHVNSEVEVDELDSDLESTEAFRDRLKANVKSKTASRHAKTSSTSGDSLDTSSDETSKQRRSKQRRVFAAKPAKSVAQSVANAAVIKSAPAKARLSSTTRPAASSRQRTERPPRPLEIVEVVDDGDSEEEVDFFDRSARPTTQRPKQALKEPQAATAPLSQQPQSKRKDLRSTQSNLSKRFLAAIGKPDFAADADAFQTTMSQDLATPGALTEGNGGQLFLGASSSSLPRTTEHLDLPPSMDWEPSHGDAVDDVTGPPLGEQEQGDVDLDDAASIQPAEQLQARAGISNALVPTEQPKEAWEVEFLEDLARYADVC